jgi:hypothetical protein
MEIAERDDEVSTVSVRLMRRSRPRVRPLPVPYLAVDEIVRYLISSSYGISHQAIQPAVVCLAGSNETVRHMRHIANSTGACPTGSSL